MGKKILILAGVLIILAVILGVLIYMALFNSVSKNTSTNTPSQFTKIGNVSHSSDRDVSLFLENQGFVQDLPKSITILIRFYNSEDAEKQWKESYVLTRANVEKITMANVERTTTQNYNILITLDEKELYNPDSDLCAIMKNAKQNEALGFETSLSQTELLWKFKSMLKYRDCLGV